MKMFDRKVPPLEEQGEKESQKIWQDVTKALVAFDYSTAGTAKSVIEDRQRDLAKQRTETGEVYQHDLFYYDSESERWLLKNYEERFEELSRGLTK